MQLTDLKARIIRLEGLLIGPAREAALWREVNDPLLYRERRAYLGGLQRALDVLVTDRVSLARARRRLQQAESRWPHPPSVCPS